MFTRIIKIILHFLNNFPLVFPYDTTHGLTLCPLALRMGQSQGGEVTIFETVLDTAA